jgi:hypothetical protein
MRGCPLLFVCFLTEEEEEEEEEEEDVEAIVACARVVCVVANILCVFMYPCVCARESMTFHFYSLRFFIQKLADFQNIRKKRLKQQVI